MKARSALLCLCLVISLTTLISHKRVSIEDDLFAKMNAYFSENVSFGLYVHTDKNIYVPGEIIWLKAYLTGDTTLQNEVLYVRLVDQNNQPVMKKEFAMYDVRAHGNITLPDDLTEGKYRLYAYTDKMINFSPREVFNREITVVDNSSIALEATAFLADTAALSQGKDVDVVCKLTRDGVSIADAKCNYVLLDSANNVLFEGKTNTNNIGGAMFNLPAKHLKADAPLTLNILFNKGKTESRLSYVLPKRSEYFHLSYNINGQGCIAGVPCRINFDVTDLNGEPANAKLTLLQNNAIKQNVTAVKGKGALQLNAQAANTYTLLVQQQDQKQLFPLKIDVNPAGYTLNVMQKDGGRVAIINKRNSPDELAIILRSERDILWSRMLNFEGQDSLVVAIPAVNTNSQLLSLALFNTQSKLVAEQIIANSSNVLNMQVTKVDKDGKSFMAIKLATANQDKSLPGNLSVAVVAKQVIDTNSYRSINPASARPNTLHSWNDILSYNPRGSISTYSNTSGVWGVVHHKKNKPIKIKNIFLKNSEGLQIIKLDRNGRFSIPAEMLITTHDGSNNLFLESRIKYDYTIEVKDYAGAFDKKVIGGFYNLMQPNTISYAAAEKPLAGLKDVIALKVVNVTAVKTMDRMERIAKAKADYPIDCADYVCQFNWLNCLMHVPSPPEAVRPQIGVEYIYQGWPTTYWGCVKPLLKPREPLNKIVKNISVPLEFDKTNIDGFSTTVYWQPNIYTDEKGDAYVEVPITSTSIKDYRIVVEGITGEMKPLFATQTIKWKTNK
ncbi:hypothetical protein IM792_00050 [Mucilaginibacter sp. JRF]|uniref:hypothetical protein n=1 Tax=Mucilaginibacter sp. JRF TaxID=2780088 RepID=UPI001882C287|nr:hypothetical protein [Mucilaginibacter sp. JRF]MBE9582827.1 hypothetical protein [Mucilaginibacter sp. JRF]